VFCSAKSFNFNVSGATRQKGMQGVV